MSAHLKLLLSKTENAFHATIQIFGTMKDIDAKAAPKLMFLTRNADDVFAQTIYRSTLVLNVSNA